jgi:hypothetical protein
MRILYAVDTVCMGKKIKFLLGFARLVGGRDEMDFLSPGLKCVKRVAHCSKIRMPEWCQKRCGAAFAVLQI